MKDLKSIIELLNGNSKEQYFARLDTGSIVLVLGRVMWSDKMFCKVISSVVMDKGGIIQVRPDDIKEKLTLDQILGIVYDEEDECSIPTPLIGEFALTDAGNLVLVKEQATPDTFTCEVIIPCKNSLHRVGGTIRMSINKMHLVPSGRVAEIIKESIHNPENPEYKKGDIVELKDDYSAIYRLGYTGKNDEVYYSMKYEAKRIEGEPTISVSKCEVPIHSIKCIANGKRIDEMRKALTSVIGLL